MQSFASLALSAAQRTDLTEPLRYAVQRFGELLDPNAHFAAAASFTLDPITAAAEFLDLARAHASSGGKNPSRRVMLDGVARTKAAVVQDPHASAWFATECRAAVATLDRAADPTAPQAAGVGRGAWVIQETSVAGRGAVRTLHTRMSDPVRGYRRRLVDRVCTICARPTLTTSEWLKFDAELRLLSAVALAEGRTDARLAKQIATGLARALDSTSAVAHLRSVLGVPSDDYIVALLVDGIRSPQGLRPFGLRHVTSADARWHVTQTFVDADPALHAFCTAQYPKAVIVAAVTAFDFEHAASLAWQRSERLADQYGAQHRAYAIAVNGPALVLRCADGSISEQRTDSRRLPFARARLSRPDPRLEQSLRYASLARTERAPVVQVLHSWIALETLARGQGLAATPYPFLMDNLAPSLAVHAVRQSLAATWHIASRAGRRSQRSSRWIEVERWLGIQNTHRNLADLDRWVDLMRHRPPAGTPAPVPLSADASLDEASAVFLEVLPNMIPFAREAILRWRWRLERGNRLSNWCDEVRTQASATLGRMYVMRNATVHTAVTQATGGDQLAHAAKNVVDAVYEVMPPWLTPSQPTWQAFERLARRAEHVHRTWNHRPREALLNAQNLTRPGGDGLTR